MPRSTAGMYCRGIDAAHDLVVEDEPGAPRQRRDADPAVAVLTAAAGLLLVLPLPFRPAPQRLAIGDLRLADQRVHAELPRQTSHHDLEVPLTQAADQRLSQLRVVLVVERRILLVQLVQPRGELVFLAALLHLHRDRDHGLRERDLGQHDLVRLGGKRVVGMGVAQLGHDADVPRVQLGDLGALLAHRHAQVVELLASRCAARCRHPGRSSPSRSKPGRSVTSPTCGSEMVLNTCATNGPASSGWDRDALGAAPLCALERAAAPRATATAPPSSPATPACRT